MISRNINKKRRAASPDIKRERVLCLCILNEMSCHDDVAYIHIKQPISESQSRICQQAKDWFPEQRAYDEEYIISASYRLPRLYTMLYRNNHFILDNVMNDLTSPQLLFLLFHESKPKYSEDRIYLRTDRFDEHNISLIIKWANRLFNLDADVFDYGLSFNRIKFLSLMSTYNFSTKRTRHR
jgi:hypothetical protein